MSIFYSKIIFPFEKSYIVFFWLKGFNYFAIMMDHPKFEIFQNRIHPLKNRNKKLVFCMNILIIQKRNIYKFK